MREQADGDAEVQSMQGHLHMIRGECFHSDRPREAAQDSQSVELLRTMDPMCRTTCMALSWTCVPWHDTYAPLQRLAG
jgi:hypothetical protein